MADQVATWRTTVDPEEVIARAVPFFTTDKWRATTQSGRVATFEGKPPIPFFLILGTLVGFLFFLIPGIIMYLFVIRRVNRFQNLTVTANPMDESGSEVVITHPKRASKLVQRFLSTLPEPAPSASAVEESAERQTG